MAIRSVGLAVVLAGLLTGCGWFGGSSSNQQAQIPPDPSTIKHPEDPYHPHQETQDGGFLMNALFGNSNSNSSSSSKSDGGKSGGPSGVGVNTYLWHATLDTVSFMPLASADPFGGVIITDWYSPPETQNERFKVNILILGRDLRADGLRCTVFRQKRDPGGEWIEVAVDPQTAIDLENAILTRARQMRLSTAAAAK
jgi:hypothetical protein